MKNEAEARPSKRAVKINTTAVLEFRKREGLTITSLAKAAGISQGSMSHIENGTRLPSPPVVKAIATALKVPVAAILAEVD